MRVAVTSQNFRTITGHGGKARRFMIYEVTDGGIPTLSDKLDLPRDMSMHEHPLGAPHPIDGIDVLVTGGCGEGFVRKLAMRGIRVVTTSETDPQLAVALVSRGEDLSPAQAEHEQAHEEDGVDGHGCGCNCGHD